MPCRCPGGGAGNSYAHRVNHVSLPGKEDLACPAWQLAASPGVCEDLGNLCTERPSCKACQPALVMDGGTESKSPKSWVCFAHTRDKLCILLKMLNTGPSPEAAECCLMWHVCCCSQSCLCSWCVIYEAMAAHTKLSQKRGSHPLRDAFFP